MYLSGHIAEVFKSTSAFFISMRSTYTGLQTTALRYCQSDSTDTGIVTFVKEEINTVCREIFSELQQFIDHKTQTASTVATQQYYHYPPVGNQYMLIS